MANTLTNLLPDIYAALNIVSRERVGLIPAVTVDANVNRVAVNETVRIPIAPAASAENITPATNPPDTGDQTFTNATVTITNQRAVPFRWTGEEQRGVNNGPGYASLQVQQIAQALRTLSGEVEEDLAQLYSSASRGYGTAGTTPFASADDLTDASELLRILEDNGAPSGDLHLVLGSAALAKLRGKQSGLFHVNEAGTSAMLRGGSVGELMGFMLHQSAKIQTHTKGTATGFDANGGEPVDETTIVVDGSDSGTILAGDVVTWAGDTNKYIVQSATASGAASGNIVIAEPGLREALATTVEGTIGNSYTANLAFSRNAMVLAARQPALPEEGDMADDRITVTDPVSGISFEFAMYRQYRRVRYEVALAWGVSCIKPEHMAILIG